MALVFLLSIAMTAIFVQTAFGANLLSSDAQTSIYFCEFPKTSIYPGLNMSNSCDFSDCQYMSDYWITSRYVTAEVNSERCVDGAGSTNLKIAESFPGGTIAYLNFDDQLLNLSKYHNISLWIKSDTDISNGMLQFVLYEGNNDGTETLSVPALDGDSWQKINLRLSGSINNYDAITSIALFTPVQPADSFNLWIDMLSMQTDTNMQIAHTMMEVV
jgi:hypothetical protein